MWYVMLKLMLGANAVVQTGGRMDFHRLDDPTITKSVVFNDGRNDRDIFSK